MTSDSAAQSTIQPQTYNEPHYSPYKLLELFNALFNFFLAPSRSLSIIANINPFGLQDIVVAAYIFSDFYFAMFQSYANSAFFLLGAINTMAVWSLCKFLCDSIVKLNTKDSHIDAMFLFSIPFIATVYAMFSAVVLHVISLMPIMGIQMYSFGIRILVEIIVIAIGLYGAALQWIFAAYLAFTFAILTCLHASSLYMALFGAIMHFVNR